MIHYSITREQYLELIRDILTRERKKIGAVVSLIFSGIAFPVISAWFIAATDIKPWLKIACAALAVISLALSFFRFFFLSTRARMVLKQAESSGQLPEDYWKEHTMELKGSRLLISFGSVKREIPADKITATGSTENLWSLGKSKNVLEIIPKSAISESEWESFLARLFETAHEDVSAQLADHYHKTSAEAIFNRTFKLTEEEMVRLSVQMKRRSYLTRAGWSKTDLFHVIAPLVLGGYCLFARSYGYAALALVLLLAFNVALITVFLPVYRKILAGNILKPAPEGYRCVVAFKQLYFYGRYQVLTFKLSDLKKAVPAEDALFLYFDRQQMCFVPAELARPVLAAIAGKRSIADNAHLGKTDEAGREGEDA